MRTHDMQPEHWARTRILESKDMNVITHRFAASDSPRTSLRGPDVARIGVGHALIDNCSSEQVCASIIAHAQNRGKPAYVITSNAQHIVQLEKERSLQEVYDHADLVIPDGISLLIAARLYGRSLQQRVAGVDIFTTLCGLAAKNDLHVFLLGGRPGSADLAAMVMKGAYPNLKYSTYCPPLGFEQSAAGLKETANAITAAQPDILFVAFGAPKQEYWIYEHGLHLAVPVCIGVGGSFEIVGGVVPRAPLWAQNIGCEWLYRLCREPRRMWRRYLIGNLEFAAIVLRQRIRRAFLDTFVHFVNEDRFAAELSEVALLPHDNTTGQPVQQRHSRRRWS
jgi:N-acetylglucosaminyldiphosphoundecaprenol N-acetyl-beta-D-mannosaminyltransferase